MSAQTGSPATSDAPPADAPRVAVPAAHVTPADAGSWGEVLRVGVPLALSSGTMALMHAVDRLLLATYSLDALAAALPAGMIHWLLMSLFYGTTGYVNTFVAQYEGAGDPRGVAKSLWQAIHLSWLAGLLVLSVIPFAGTIFAWGGHAPGVQKLEVQYFSMLLLGAGASITANVLSCFYSGRGRTGIVLAVNVTANLVNLVLDWLLIFGKGPFPEMGAAGAGLATAISQFAALGLFLWILFRGEEGRTYPLRETWRFDPSLFLRLLRFGFPAGIHMVLDGAAMTLFVVLVGKLGTLELAAVGLVFNLNFLAYSPVLGLGTAVSTLVGQRVGEGQPQIAVASAWKTFAVAVLYTLLCIGAYVLRPDWLVTPYVADHPEFAGAEGERFLALVGYLLKFVAVYALFDAAAVIFGCACRGAGDVWFVLILSVLSSWLLMIAPTAWAVQRGTLTLDLAFASVTLFIVVLGLGSMARFVGGKWKTMNVIH